MDVEAILNQIRERVVSEQNGANETRISAARSSTNGSVSATNHDDALHRLRTYLSIAGRAADRLPPVISNREGAWARLELWIKKKSMPLTRWFTWEQVNFNRAVNDALCDVVEILKAEAQELAALRAQLTQQVSILRAEANQQAGELQDFEARLNETRAALARLANESGARYAELAERHSTLVTEHTKLAGEVIDLAPLREEDREIQAKQNEEINQRLVELAADIRAEQRVCFRQLSLVTSESAVLEDRARRAVLARLEKLEEELKGRKL